MGLGGRPIRNGHHVTPLQVEHVPKARSRKLPWVPAICESEYTTPLPVFDSSARWSLPTSTGTPRLHPIIIRRHLESGAGPPYHGRVAVSCRTVPRSRLRRKVRSVIPEKSAVQFPEPSAVAVTPPSPCTHTSTLLPASTLTEHGRRPSRRHYPRTGWSPYGSWCSSHPKRSPHGPVAGRTRPTG